MEWSAKQQLAEGVRRFVAAGRPRWLTLPIQFSRPRWLTADRMWLAVALLVAVLVRAALAPRGELLWDMDMYVKWGDDLLHRPADVYSVSGANYPPLTLYIFAGVVALYRFLAPRLHQPGALDTHDPLLSFLAKLPTLLTDIGTVILLYVLLRRRVGERWAIAVAAVYALGPAVLLDGVVWGQTDGIPVFFLLLCLLAIFAGRYGWAGLLFGLAIMVKPQPIIFGPVLLLYVYRSAGWRPALAACATAGAAVLAICAPYLLPPRPHAPAQLLVFYDNTVYSFQQSYPIAPQNTATPPGAVSWNAFNLWWLLGPERSYRAPMLGPVSASTIGTLLFLGVLGLALVGVWRGQSRLRLFSALSLTAVGFFALATLQHERYMFQALAFLLLAAAYDRRYILPCVVAQVAVFFNIGYVALWYLAMHAYERAALPLYMLGRTHPSLLRALAWAVVGLCLALVALSALDLTRAARRVWLPRQRDLVRRLRLAWG